MSTSRSPRQRAPRFHPTRGTLHLNALPKRARSAKLQARSHALHARLEALFEAPIDLWITQNKRSFVRAIPAQGDHTMRLRLHRFFLQAPESVYDALKLLCLCAHPPTLQHARNVLHQFIDEAQTQAAAPRPVALKPQGTTYNLLEHYQHTISSLPEDDPQLGITWGRRARRAHRQRSIRLGSYDFQRRIIRIHPALDQPLVPPWALRFVIFHEILHHFIPPVATPRRTLQHPPAFRAREAQHPDCERFDQWLQTHLSTLLHPDKS